MATKKSLKPAYLTDNSTEEDFLDFSDYVEILKDVILNAETPITLGIFGPWGAGKSSLMVQLQKSIKRGGLPKSKTVWFTAWKYDKSDALWRAFVLRVIDSLYPIDNKTQERIPLEDIKDKDQIDAVKELMKLEEIIYHPLDWEEKGQFKIDWTNALKGGGKALVDIVSSMGVIPGLGIIEGLSDTIFGDDANLASAIGREIQNYHREQLLHREQFEDTFAKVLELILKENGRLVIFVDDLDRCLPEKSLEILEAIKLFLDVKRTVFVIGMDKEVVELGVEARYHDVFKNLGVTERTALPISGSSYLQKIIQIPFNIPDLYSGKVENFIINLQSTQSHEVQLEPLVRQIISRGAYPNPRYIKRIINIFTLLKKLVHIRERRSPEEGGLEDGAITYPLLVKSIIIQVQWPELYEDWKKDPSLIKRIEAYCHSNSGNLIKNRVEPKENEQKYLNNTDRYYLLDQMLTFPQYDTENELSPSNMISSFLHLHGDQIAQYIYLTSIARTIRIEMDTPFSNVRPVILRKPIDMEEDDSEGQLDFLNDDV